MLTSKEQAMYNVQKLGQEIQPEEHRMKQDIKEKWLNALRSGEYLQGKDSLQPAPNTFCCLGVLCDIAIKEGAVNNGHWIEADEGNGFKFASGMLSDEADFYRQSYEEEEDGELPRTVRRWAEVDSCNPQVLVTINEEGHQKQLSLAELNDTWNYDFKKIADLIEKQL